MTPQTRSHGKPPAPVASSASTSTSASAPKPKPAKVYKSTPAAPKQTVFPPRKRHIKTYNSRNRKVRKDSQQTTLTQMFPSQSSTRDKEKESLVLSGDEDAGEDDEIENQVKEPEASAAEEVATPKKRSRSSRRKTAGDNVVVNEKPKNAKRRKTLGDAPTSSASSSFHTQTLTQMPSMKNLDDKMWQINDSEAEDDEDDDTALIMETPKKPKDDASSKINQGKTEPQTEVKSSVPSLIPSVTPTNRQSKKVIPSSTSPETPRLFRGYSPASHNSPLIARSTNISAPSPIIKMVKTPKTKEIPDSYSTTHSLHTTPTQSSATKPVQKKARFDIPEDIPEDIEMSIENKENITPKRTKPKSPKPKRKTPARSPLKPIRKEVADSDDDDGTIADDDETVGDDEVDITNGAAMVENQNVPREPQSDDIPSTEIPSTDDPEPAESYGVIGEETQAILNASTDEFSLELSTSDSRESSPPGTPTPKPKEKRREVFRAEEVQTPTTSKNPVVIMSSPQEESSDENITSTHTQVYTQGIESQRLPLEAIRSLGPQTQHSDIVLPLHPEPLEQILDRTKNHEFRSWKIAPGVCRIWIYATKPIQEVRYMFVVGDPKVPGEIEDESGLGNAEFNQGNTRERYAYEILQVYELNDPVSLGDMIQRGWCKAPPQKFSWLPQAVVGELTGNLKCALFEEDATESQELIAQIQSDVEYSTQHQSAENMDEIIPASQSPRRPTNKGKGKGKSSQARVSSNNSFAKPAIPQIPSEPSAPSLPAPAARTSQDQSQIQRTRSFVRPSQATTVSSPGVSPQKSLRNINIISSDPPVPAVNSSPAAYRSDTRSGNNSLRSSQFLSRSQMLPDSLVNDEIQEPPPIMWDSADEQSD